jgi:hypothetical protein
MKLGEKLIKSKTQGEKGPKKQTEDGTQQTTYTNKS